MPGGLVTQQIRHHVVRNNGVGGVGIASVGGGGGGGGGGGVGFTCSQFYGHGPSTLFHNLFKMNYININVDETDNNTAANSNNNNNNNNNNNHNNNNTNNNNNNNNNHNSDLLQIGSLKPRYIMDDIFHREEERLKTFVNWPLDWLNKNDLAMTGMFYMGEDDKCKCYFCEVEIGRWERTDEPVSEHLRWSPNCPLLRRRTTNNVPLNAEALDSALPAPSYDICGLNDTIEVRPQAIVDEVRTNSSTQLPGSTGNSTNNGEQFVHYYPDYPEYAIETARLRSYAEWPRHMKQKPKELAEAGFFYTGMGDRVKCFSCGGGLKDWDENDDPWEEHAMWMSKCRYLKLMKGQSYIDAILAKHKSKEMEKLNNKPQINDDQEKDQATATAIAAAAAAAAEVATATLTSTAATTAAVPTTSAVAGSPADAVAGDSNNSNCCTETMRKLTNCSIPEEKICKICYNAEYNTAFLPCGHVVACAKCASSVTKCPMCRKPFTDVMRVYFS